MKELKLRSSEDKRHVNLPSRPANGSKSSSRRPFILKSRCVTVGCCCNISTSGAIHPYVLKCLMAVRFRCVICVIDRSVVKSVFHPPNVSVDCERFNCRIVMALVSARWMSVCISMTPIAAWFARSCARSGKLSLTVSDRTVSVHTCIVTMS